MSRVISATVYIRDVCDPDVPGDCAPVVEIEGALEIEGLVSEFGISFEEASQDQEDTMEEDLVEVDEAPESELELELDEIPTDQIDCPLEPGVDWDESVCGEIERRIVARVLGG